MTQEERAEREKYNLLAEWLHTSYYWEFLKDELEQKRRRKLESLVNCKTWDEVREAQGYIKGLSELLKYGEPVVIERD